MMERKQQLKASLSGSVSEVYAALGQTLAFRRWQSPGDIEASTIPAAGRRYRYQTESVLRLGRIVETIRPVGITLYEILHDSPCRVILTIRWRIEPVPAGCVVRLRVSYRLNRAASLRAGHWERRLLRHFRKQFAFLASNLAISQDVCALDRRVNENVT